MNEEESGQSQELKEASPRENEKPSTMVPLCQLRHPRRVHPGEQRATELVTRAPTQLGISCLTTPTRHGQPPFHLEATILPTSP